MSENLGAAVGMAKADTLLTRFANGIGWAARKYSDSHDKFGRNWLVTTLAQAFPSASRFDCSIRRGASAAVSSGSLPVHVYGIMLTELHPPTLLADQIGEHLTCLKPSTLALQRLSRVSASDDRRVVLTLQVACHRIVEDLYQREVVVDL